MKRATLTVSGMSCGHCVSRVKKTLTGLSGVDVRSVEVGRADIDFDPTLQTLAAVTSALGAAGYPAEVREEA